MLRKPVKELQASSFYKAIYLFLLWFIESAGSYYPFFFNQRNFRINGWHIFSVENEYNKIIGFSELWKVSDINKGHEVCYFIFSFVCYSIPL